MDAKTGRGLRSPRMVEGLRNGSDCVVVGSHLAGATILPEAGHEGYSLVALTVAMCLVGQGSSSLARRPPNFVGTMLSV